MEKNTSDIILVPWDFTEKSKDALRHALRISDFLKTEIEVLHVTEDENQDLLSKTKQDLEKYLKKIAYQRPVPVKMIFIEGSIFSSITDYANSINARLVIMGTHGIRGFQKLTGSWAYKVLLGAKMPYLIVKKRPRKTEEFTDIVFPVDFKKENIEKIEAAIYLNKTFNAKIHVFKAPVLQKKLMRQTNVNMNISLQLLARENVDFEVHNASPSRRFDYETIRFAKKIEADLILVVTSEHSIKEKLFGEHEQFIIDNDAGIPVMCINPTEDYRDM